MPTPPKTAPLKDPSDDGKLKNWAGNHVYSVQSIHEPRSIEEVRALIMKYERLKILGSRHCFNAIADSKDQLISLAGLDKIYDPDKAGHTVTVEAGVRYGELAIRLEEKGSALHNLASLPHISVVGGTATATHGSGIHNGNLTTAVRAMEFMLASGDTITLSQEKDGEQFNGAAVHLGALGVVTRITLNIEPAYRMSQQVYEDLPLDALEHHFDEIMSAGYSVSLFTDWRNRKFNEVWIKSRIGGSRASGFFGATPATRDLHPIRDIPARHCTEQMGIPGAWHERLPHFRMGFTPSSGKELQTEYFVPRESSYQAIQAIEGLREKIAPHLLISEIRCIAADELWMSPCYQRASTAIHFTWQPDWPAVNRLLPLIEEKLAPFQARPHWGKLFTLPPQRIRTLYPKLHDFQDLIHTYDPKGKFRNEFLDTLFHIR